jgi:MFS family permease
MIGNFRIFIESLTYIVLVLYLLDSLPPEQVGLVWAVNFAVNTLLDYPTGVLGDLIGHKKVLGVAYAFKVIGILLLIPARVFGDFLIFMIVMALASSQESGALQAWFDNSYRLQSKTLDDDRTIYTNFTTRKGFVENVMFISGFIGGGAIATYISRQALFTFRLILEVIILVGVVLLIKEYSDGNNSDLSFKSYLKQTYSGIYFLLHKKSVFFYFIGSTFIFAVNGTVWHPLMLFRVYETYSGSDAGAGVLRSLIFAGGLLWQFVLIKRITHFGRRSYWWVFVSSVMSNAVFFGLIMLYFILFPPIGFDLLLVIGFFLIYQIPSFLESLEYILRNKINLDLVPDELRNSVYSLIPTIVTGLGFPFVLIGGYVIGTFGFVSGFYVLIIISLTGSILLGLGLLFQAKEIILS